MTASSFGLRKKPAASGPAAEKYAIAIVLSGDTATRSNGEPISYATGSASVCSVSSDPELRRLIDLAVRGSPPRRG